MKVIRTILELRKVLKNHNDESVGFVPTMGAFHEGHLSLMKQSKIENDVTVVSLFVNPLQFGPNEDLDTYPRHEKEDIALLERIEVDYLFIPSVNEMYPNEPSIHLSVKARTDQLCGMSRPTHFDGVVTVLIKLFNIVQPTRAYFGLKDAQQFAVVDLFISQLNIPVELVGLPTVREESGLAKSSRNEYLSNEEKEKAAAIFQSLYKGKMAVKEKGIKDSSLIEEIVKTELQKNTNGVIDYVDVLSYPDLKEIDMINETFIIAVAIHFKNARLIDNLIMSPEGKIINQLRRNIDDTNDDAR